MRSDPPSRTPMEPSLAPAAGPAAAGARVLVVEDDRKLALLVRDYLVNEGFEAELEDDGLRAVQRIRNAAPQAVILDLMLPGLDGYAVCREVRQFSDVPILMLTARVDEIDRLRGLDGGADDYVCKPFSPREVVARVRALVRRAQGRKPAPAVPWTVDAEGLRIAWRGQWLPLTPVEYRMFSQMLARPGRAFTRSELLDGAHTDLRDVSDRAIDSHIKNLRRKIDAAQPGCDCITSVYGVGYRFDPPA